MKIPVSILALLVLFDFSCAQAPLQGNARSMVITPPLELGYTLGGYGARMSKPATGIHDDIRAKALVLSDGSKKFVIVTMDILGFPPNVRPMIVEKLRDTGWKAENIMLLPSHAHSSLEMFALNDKNIFAMPAIGIFQPELLDFIVEKLAGLITETEQQLIPVQVGTGQITLEKLNRNRRGSAAVDRELTVTRVDDLNNNPVAVLVNWTAHPTIMDADDMWVSGGWPGYLQRELEDWIGSDVVAMYYNGAEGDQSVIARGGAGNYEKAEKYGRTIAMEVLPVYRNIATSINPVFGVANKVIPLPPKKPHPSFMQTGGKEYQLDQKSIQGLLDHIWPGEVQITALQLGDLLIIGAPGELIAELGLSLKSQLKTHGATYPVIGGLANEWLSYILTEEEYQKGGYEASVSFYGPGLGTVIYNGMLDTSRLLFK